MKHTFAFVCTALSLFVISACGDGAAAENTDQAAASDPPQAAGAAQTQTYPSLPVDRMQELYNSVDYIDFVFYYTNFSMNQANDASIKATLAHVSNETPTVYPDCQPIGSLFFQAQGQELMQAELYFSSKCVYFVWLENGQRTYANKMTPAGFQFYKQVFAQAGQAQ